MKRKSGMPKSVMGIRPHIPRTPEQAEEARQAYLSIKTDPGMIPGTEGELLMANDRFIPEVKIEDTRIMFRNFAGAEGQFNRAGDRNFAVPLDPETATRMIEDGWNVKQLKPREEGDQPQDYVQVSVSYKGKPPRIVMVSSRGRTPLGEEELNMLDYAEIEKVDLILNPYKWVIPARGNQEEKSGVKAYLKSLYVTIREDELEKKYANVPESAASVRQYDTDED